MKALHYTTFKAKRQVFKSTFMFSYARLMIIEPIPKKAGKCLSESSDRTNVYWKLILIITVFSFISLFFWGGGPNETDVYKYLC